VNLGGFNYVSLHQAGGHLGLPREDAETNVLDGGGLSPSSAGPISIPTDRIKDIKIVYNDQFKQFHGIWCKWGPIRFGEKFPFDGTQSGPIAITNTLLVRPHSEFPSRLQHPGPPEYSSSFLGDKRGQAKRSGHSSTARL